MKHLTLIALLAATTACTTVPDHQRIDRTVYVNRDTQTVITDTKSLL